MASNTFVKTRQPEELFAYEFWYYDLLPNASWPNQVRPIQVRQPCKCKFENALTIFLVFNQCYNWYLSFLEDQSIQEDVPSCFDLMVPINIFFLSISLFKQNYFPSSGDNHFLFIF